MGRISIIFLVTYVDCTMYSVLGVYSCPGDSHRDWQWDHVYAPSISMFNPSYMVMLSCIQGYFYRKRALALGIYSSGVSLGGALCTPLFFMTH